MNVIHRYRAHVPTQPDAKEDENNKGLSEENERNEAKRNEEDEQNKETEGNEKKEENEQDDQDEQDEEDEQDEGYVEQEKEDAREKEDDAEGSAPSNRRPVRIMLRTNFEVERSRQYLETRTDLSTQVSGLSLLTI